MPSLNTETFSSSLHLQTQEDLLGSLPRKNPVAVGPATPLAEALALMHERKVGSLLVLDEAGGAQGILTEHDIIDRVTLPQRALSTPISQVMSTPVHTLGVGHTVHDAALLMSRHGIRHVPVIEGGRVVNLVSERDVFALQRLSLKPISAAIRGASDVPMLAEAASEIRRFAGELLAHGVAARQTTQLISHLNDVLTERLVHLLAVEEGVDMQRACWLAFGSEGRSEQTIATDQDNGLVFESEDANADRPRWLAFGRRVNLALDECGYPLCKGKVMAGEPACCLTSDEWCGRFARWMEHGAPEDLLMACIYFDFRALTGRCELAQPMRELVRREAARLPRFLKQMGENALANTVPLGWLGGFDTERVDGRSVLNLKFHGATIFVDAARLFALATGGTHTGTRERFEAAAPLLHVPASESEAWVSAFEFVQTLRLRTQLRDGTNMLDPATLNDMERRTLKDSLRVAKGLQQRIELDYRR